jgi:hypothetical protein
VERSDTHQFPFAKMMGFAKGSTHPTGCHRNFDGQRHGRFYKWRDDAMVPLICPTCQNVFAGKASMPAPPCYFAWGCFQYFSSQPDGWSACDTHQLPFAKMMGFAKGTTPSYYLSLKQFVAVISLRRRHEPGCEQ